VESFRVWVIYRQVVFTRVYIYLQDICIADINAIQGAICVSSIYAVLIQIYNTCTAYYKCYTLSLSYTVNCSMSYL